MPEINTIFARQQGSSGYRGYGFPSQTVSVAEKEKDQWKLDCMFFFQGEAQRQTREKIRDTKKYKMLADDFQYPSNTWAFDPLFLGDKKETEYGATDPIQHYPIMNMPLNTIWGERINRQYRYYCLSDSPASLNAYNREKTEMLFETVSQTIQNNALQKAIRRVQGMGIEIDEQVLQQAQQEAQQMSGPQIQRYMDKDWVDVIEQSANRMLKNIWRMNNLDDEFLEGFRHGTISGKEHYEIAIANGRIQIKNLNPFSVFKHQSPSTRWTSEGQYAGTRLFLTPSSVLDLYRDKLTVEDIQYIESKIYPSTRAGGVNSLTGIKSISFDTFTFSDQFGGTYRDLNMEELDQMVTEYMVTGMSSPRMGTQGLIEVIQAYWKSYRKAGVLHFYDENDEEETMWVDENYKPNKKAGEWVKWFFLNQVYQGTLIDNELVVSVEPYPYQSFDANDPDYSPLPIEGCEYNNYNGKTITLTDLMLPWQEMYDIVAYELRRDMKKAMGKVMFMSYDHIPNIPGFSMEKWMYWCREFGIAWVGEGKKRAQFSHYSAQDMSFAEQLIAKMNMLDRIKYNCDQFAGFSQPRLANTSNEETARQSMQSQQNSVNQTEYYFWKHSQTIQRVLTIALNTSKKLIRNGDIMVLRTMYDDMEQKYLESDAASVRNARLNLFVVHGSQTIARTEAVRQMAIAAAGKSGDQLDMSDLILAQTENEIRQNLRELRRMAEQRAEQGRQHEKELVQMQNQEKAEQRAWDKEKHYSKLQSDERREYMRTFINQDDNMKDVDDNGMADIFEGQRVIEEQAENLREHQRQMRQQDLDQQNQSEDRKLKRRELKIKEDANKIELKNQENDLKIAKQNARNRSKSKS